MEGKTTRKQKKGKYGEDRACEFLERKGWRILERNFRCKAGEIDIVALGEGHLCFVEVKYRSRMDYGMPRDAVGRAKQRRLIMVAMLYMKLHPWLRGDYSPRMDIVEVLELGGEEYIRHTPGAFSV